MSQWNLEGDSVEGMYLEDIPVKGKVVLSRVKYGGSVSHHVVLDEGINSIYGVKREKGETVIIPHDSIKRVYSAI